MPQALPPRADGAPPRPGGGPAALPPRHVPLLGPDEPRYARVAVEMQRAGEWVTPDARRASRGSRSRRSTTGSPAPPSGCSARTRSAARLPVGAGRRSSLVGTTALVGARLFGAAAGLHAGFVLAHVASCSFAYGRAASMDMLLAATVTVGHRPLRRCACFGVAGRWALPAACAAVGLATLAKGPLGVAAARPRGRGLRGRRPATCGRCAWPCTRAGCSSLFLPWPRPGTPRSSPTRAATSWTCSCSNHNVARFTSTVHNHPGPVLLLRAGAPRRPLPVVGPRRCPPSPACGRARDRADLFLLALARRCPSSFFSLAGSKLPGYILPCLPPLALLMGRAAARWIAADEDAPRPPGPAAGRPPSSAWSCGALVAAGPFVLARSGEPAWASVAAAGRLGAARRAWPWSRRIGTRSGRRAAPAARRRRRLPAAPGPGRARRSWPGASRAARSSCPPRAARCWPGAPGARPGWPATSTTTAACARSGS